MLNLNKMFDFIYQKVLKKVVTGNEWDTKD